MNTATAPPELRRPTPLRPPRQTRLVSSFPNHGDRQFAIDLLLEAKKRIQNGETEYVCEAISSACFARDPRNTIPRLEAVAQKLRGVIRSSLGRRLAVTSWLIDKHPSFCKAAQDFDWCQRYRVA